MNESTASWFLESIRSRSHILLQSSSVSHIICNNRDPEPFVTVYWRNITVLPSPSIGTNSPHLTSSQTHTHGTRWRPKKWWTDDKKELNKAFSGWMHHARPKAWNEMSTELQDLTDHSAFRRQLKTFLFERAFTTQWQSCHWSLRCKRWTDCICIFAFVS